MTNKDEFDYFMEQMLENAAKEFRATEESLLLHEKMDQMDRDCDTMLTNDEKDFAVECFELIMQVDSRQENYVYRKAFKDCVCVLKELGVLA